MKLVPVSLVIFHEKEEQTLKVWTQVREDDGPYHGLLEFPGGGIEAMETPLAAAVREVEEEVGITIRPEDGTFMGIYENPLPGRTILLYVHLFPRYETLEGKGHWLTIQNERLSSPYLGQIPQPNHKIIDELYRALIG